MKTRGGLTGELEARRFLIAGCSAPAVWLTATLIVLPGCRNETAPMGRIQGTVLDDEGHPLKADEIRIAFYLESTEAGIRPRPAMGLIDGETGRIGELTTWRDSDGVPPGRHRVVITAYKQSQHGPVPTEGVVPKQYTRLDSTPLIADIEGGQVNTLAFVIESRP